MMLHEGDKSVILQHPGNPSGLYLGDNERGKIVEEWKVGNGLKLTGFAPESKFAQITTQRSFLGISDDSIFRIDPRIPGDKITDVKKYASDYRFSALSTTEDKCIAVASRTGKIRLYDKVGGRAKACVPTLEEPVNDLDVSADGHWILATCNTYLLLVDAFKRDQVSGFKYGFEKDAKPLPKCLQLKYEKLCSF